MPAREFSAEDLVQDLFHEMILGADKRLGLNSLQKKSHQGEIGDSK